LILFLDFDGVLHPDPCRERTRLFENAPRLAAVLDRFAEVDVVLSTAWRAMHSVDELASSLPASLAARVMGVTPHFCDFDAPRPLVPYTRHAECLQWIRMHGASDRDWIALDDRAGWFAPYCEQLLTCDAQRGFDRTVAARLRSTLTRARQRMTQRVDAAL